jgi:hypothetical protein
MSDDDRVDVETSAPDRGQRPSPDTPESDDPFAPPREPCECYCLHCRRVFMSTGIWFQRIRNSKAGHLDGFWMCPTPNCDGKGFTFDIFPTDPNHPANEGWTYCDDGEEEDYLEDYDSEDPAYIDLDDEPGEYDPEESKWKQLDEEFDDEDDDIEGEEWKYGLEPGERLPEPPWLAESRREWEEEQSRYDAPDERPREVDWQEPDYPPGSGGEFKEDDIPF